MAYIVKKKIGGREYYYLRQSKRVEGKVKAITIAYLGKTAKQADKKRAEIDKEHFLKEKHLKQQHEKSVRQKAAKKKMGKNEDIKESKDFISFVQEGGLIWGPEPEIYGGLAGFYTYGPIGKLLKNKVEDSVRRIFTQNGMREMEGPTVLPDSVWKASGHLETFNDRIVKCTKCEKVYRADKLIEEKIDVPADSFSDERILKTLKDEKIMCPSCDGEFVYKIETQNLMMKTKVAGTFASLRPETATVTYLPFLRFLNYFRKKLPFGVFQIGKAYRNEISPRQSVLRGREFTQAEGQFFVDPKLKNEWSKFEEIKDCELPFWTYKDQDQNLEIKWIRVGDAVAKKVVKSQAYAWCLWLAYKQFESFGIPKERIRLRQHHEDEKAFYADDAWDVEVKLNNYGWVEMCGVHDRTDYDLRQHSQGSGEELMAIREDGTKFYPHVLEIAFGTDRPTYALIDLFYEKKDEGEGKTAFRIPYSMAPIDVSIFPLMKKPELLEKSEKVKEILEKKFIIDYDISGSIGKRYLRSAKAGTPFAVTIDYESLEKNDVTIRDRDSEKQVRVKIDDLKDYIEKLLEGEKKI